MINNIKTRVNKKYATIAIYVIGTAAIIFALALALTKIAEIYSFVIGIISATFQMLLPVIIAVAVAYVIDPLVCWIEEKYKKIKFIKLKNKKIYRTLAVFSAILLIIFTIAFLVFLFIFSITKQIAAIGFDDGIKVITNYINNFSASLLGIENKLSALNIDSSKISEYISQITTAFTNGLQNIINNLLISTVNITSTLVNTIFGIIISIYLLIDKDYFIMQRNRFARTFFKAKNRKKFKELWTDFDYIFAGFVRGQLLDVLFMCVSISLMLSIVGIKFGVLIGIIAGLFNLIPYFGSIVAYIGTISFGLLNGQTKEVIIAVIILVIIQQIDAVIVGPKLLGHSVSLKPVFVMIAVIIGGSIGGMFGMIISIPVAAFLKLVLSRYMDNKLKEKEVEL